MLHLKSGLTSLPSQSRYTFSSPLKISLETDKSDVLHIIMSFSVNGKEYKLCFIVDPSILTTRSIYTCYLLLSEAMI